MNYSDTNRSLAHTTGFVICLCIILLSCSKKVTEEYVVRVKDNYLLKSELRKSIPLNTNAEDSTKLANIFIDNWIRKHVVLDQADLNLSEYQKDVNSELENYKNDLIIYRFERELLKQKLDTAISKEEIEVYYDENKEVFKLKDFALQVIYAKYPLNYNDEKKIKKLVESYSFTDSLLLAEYCERPEMECYLNANDWIYLKDLLAEVPLTIYNEDRFFKKDKFVDFEEEDHCYSLEIKDFKLKDSYSPIELETKNIRTLILNARKINLLENMREELFQNALKNGDIEINK